MIYPGETKEQVFLVPFKNTDIVKVIVTYRQSNAVVFEEVIETVEAFGENKSKFVVELSQEDTMVLKDHIPCYMQVNVILDDDKRKVAAPIMENVGTQYHREIEVQPEPEPEDGDGNG